MSDEFVTIDDDGDDDCTYLWQSVCTCMWSFNAPAPCTNAEVQALPVVSGVGILWFMRLVVAFESLVRQLLARMAQIPPWWMGWHCAKRMQGMLNWEPRRSEHHVARPRTYNNVHR